MTRTSLLRHARTRTPRICAAFGMAASRAGGVVVAFAAIALVVTGCSGRSGPAPAAQTAAHGSASVGPVAPSPPSTAARPRPLASSSPRPSTPSLPSRRSPSTAPGPALRQVPVPPACQLNAPADGLQRSADAGLLPWRLDPAHVVRECLQRDLGAADWTISAVNPKTFAVTEPRSRLTARLHLDQPARQGAGGIWAIDRIDATAPLNLPPACLVPDPAGLQAAFDQGHQPWQGNPVMVAEACIIAAFGWPHPHGHLQSTDHVVVIDESIGAAADVRGHRYTGGDIWLVTSVEPEIGQD
jgi:hypothetical protein